MFVCCCSIQYNLKLFVWWLQIQSCYEAGSGNSPWKSTLINGCRNMQAYATVVRLCRSWSLTANRWCRITYMHIRWANAASLCAMFIPRRLITIGYTCFAPGSYWVNWANDSLIFRYSLVASCKCNGINCYHDSPDFYLLYCSDETCILWFRALPFCFLCYTRQFFGGPFVLCIDSQDSTEKLKTASWHPVDRYCG